MENLSAYPHILTTPGTLVQLRNASGAFRVMAGFVTGRGDGRPRNAYLLTDEAGELCAAVKAGRWSAAGPRNASRSCRRPTRRKLTCARPYAGQRGSSSVTLARTLKP